MSVLTRVRRALWIAALSCGVGGCEALGFRRPVDVDPPVERTTPSGLVVLDLVRGRGSPSAPGDRVVVHYVARLADGAVFDSSEDRGRPVTIEIGAGDVVPGWDEGLHGLRVGGRRRLTIPPALGYGDEGLDDVVPPGATIVIEVELVEIAEPGS